jgi:hypothetical protein
MPTAYTVVLFSIDKQNFLRCCDGEKQTFATWKALILLKWQDDRLFKFANRSAIVTKPVMVLFPAEPAGQLWTSDRYFRRRILAQSWQQSFSRANSCCSQGGRSYLQKTSVTQMVAKLFFQNQHLWDLTPLATSKVLLQKTFVPQTAESFSRTTSCVPSRLL